MLAVTFVLANPHEGVLLHAAIRSVVVSVITFCMLCALNHGITQDRDVHDHAHEHEMQDEEFLQHAHEDRANEHRQQSLAMFYFRALGWRYTLAIPFFSFLAFLLVLLLVIRGRTWATGPAILLSISMPLLIGLVAALEGMVMSYQVIALSSTAPRPSEIADGISTALVAPMVALFLTVPAFLTGLIGLVVRALVDRGHLKPN